MISWIKSRHALLYAFHFENAFVNMYNLKWMHALFSEKFLDEAYNLIVCLYVYRIGLRPILYIHELYFYKQRVIIAKLNENLKFYPSLLQI